MRPIRQFFLLSCAVKQGRRKLERYKRSVELFRHQPRHCRLPIRSERNAEHRVCDSPIGWGDEDTQANPPPRSILIPFLLFFFFPASDAIQKARRPGPAQYKRLYGGNLLETSAASLSLSHRVYNTALPFSLAPLFFLFAFVPRMYSSSTIIKGVNIPSGFQKCEDGHYTGHSTTLFFGLCNG